MEHPTTTGEAAAMEQATMFAAADCPTDPAGRPPAGPPLPPVRRLVTIYEFAEISGLSVRTLERMDAARKLPKRVRIPGPGGRPLRKKVWSRRSVEDWVRRQAERSGVEA